jgi:hypothetical protein
MCKTLKLIMYVRVAIDKGNAQKTWTSRFVSEYKLLPIKLTHLISYIY